MLNAQRRPSIVIAFGSGWNQNPNAGCIEMIVIVTE